MYKIIKNVYKIRFPRDHFETCNIWAKRKGLSVFIKILCPICCLPLPGAVYMWKNKKKTCLKSDFKDIVLNLATNGQSDNINIWPQGVVCPCAGAIYMYKSIKIYTRTRCQVSVYRTTGPLVDRIIIKVAGNQDRHKSSVEFDFGPNQTTHFGVTCP